jgi:hypothetical protein
MLAGPKGLGSLPATRASWLSGCRAQISTRAHIWLSKLGNFTAAMFNHTVNEDGVMIAETRFRDLSAIFAALANPTRRLILERLSRGEATPRELARPLRISWPAVTKHLRVLERAARRHGDERPCLQHAQDRWASGWRNHRPAAGGRVDAGNVDGLRDG